MTHWRRFTSQEITDYMLSQGMIRGEQHEIRFQMEEEMVATDTTLGLDKIRCEKGFLLGKLRANKAKHREEFLAAESAWKQEVVERLEENLELARKGEEYNLYITDLPQPTDHTKDYDRLINMLEASLDDSFIVTAREFRCYVEDEWEWKETHTATVQNYLAKRA